MTSRRFILYLVVYIGRPDYQKNRHTALFFEAQDECGHTTYHVKSMERVGFEVEVRPGYDALRSVNLVGRIKIRELVIEAAELDRLMRSVPVKPQDGESNCQIWVESALRALRDAGYITEDEWMKGVDGMIDITMQAGQEPLG